MKQPTTNHAVVIIICTLLAGSALMAALKLTSVISVSWWLVMAPLWAPALMWLIVLGTITSVLIIIEQYTDRRISRAHAKRIEQYRGTQSKHKVNF